MHVENRGWSFRPLWLTALKEESSIPFQSGLDFANSCVGNVPGRMRCARLLSISLPFRQEIAAMIPPG